MAVDEQYAQALRENRDLKELVEAMEAAQFGVLRWRDEARGYIVPYRVRDPILKLLNERRPSGVGGNDGR